MTLTNPPVLGKGKSFEIYRKEILAWGELSDLPKSKQGIVVALSLPEDDNTYIRERVFDQIPLQDLKTDDGLIILLNFLDKHCGKDELVDTLEKYEDFESFEREDRQSILNFISLFDLKYKRIERKNMKLAPEVLAFRLLKKANLTRAEKLLILTGMDFENKPALYEQAKKALIKFKDCFSISSASNCEGKSFSQFKREKSWNIQGRDNQKPIKANGFARKKINQSGADGKILKCLSCGSFRHLLDDCPDSWENIAKKKNMGNEHRKALCHSNRAVLDGSRVSEEATNKSQSGVIEELNTVVTGLKEEILSLKREIKQIKIGKNRKLDGMGECFKLQSEEQAGETCLSSVLGKVGGEMKNLKSEVINLKDEIMKMKAAKDKELGKQVEGRMKNADKNRSKYRENGTDRSEIKIESMKGGLGAEMMEKKLNSYIGLESQIQEVKAIQIKENCEENQSKESQVRNDIRKEAGVKENGWDRKSEWNIVCSTYKRQDLDADSKAWHKHVIASKRDAEKHQRIITLLTVIQIKLSDYMRQYVWDTELSATEIAFWKQLMFLLYNIIACYL